MSARAEAIAVTERRKDSVRWRNWRQFVGAAQEQPKQAAAVCVVVSFNSSPAVIGLLDFLKRKSGTCDVLIVDNAGSEEHAQALREYGRARAGMNILRAVENLGSGGGYALAIEWALDRGYDFVFVTEDDVKPLRSDALEQVVLNRSRRAIVDWYYREFRSGAFTFHGRLYPAELLQVAGCPDPEYFMRSDDSEWAHRIAVAQRRTGVERKIMAELEYSHPLIKRQRSVWPIYFAIRNGLISETRRGMFRRWALVLGKRLPSSLLLGLNNGDWASLKAVLAGISDYARGRFGLEVNRKRMRHFSAFKLLAPRGATESSASRQELSRTAMSTDTGLQKILGIKGRPWWAALTENDELVAASYFSPQLPLWYCRRRMLFVEEELEKEPGRFATMDWSNGVRFRYLFAAFSLLAGTAMWGVLLAVCLPRYVAGRLRYHWL